MQPNFQEENISFDPQEYIKKDYSVFKIAAHQSIKDELKEATQWLEKLQQVLQQN